MRIEYDCSMEPVCDKERQLGFHSSILLYFSGPTIPITIEPTPYEAVDLRNQGIRIEPYRCRALIDTGAAFIVVRPSVITKLGLDKKKKGEKVIFGITGSKECPIYSGVIRAEMGVAYELPLVSCDLGEQNFDCILGRNLLRHLDIQYSGANGKFSIDDLEKIPQVSPFDDMEWWKTFFNPPPSDHP